MQRFYILFLTAAVVVLVICVIICGYTFKFKRDMENMSFTRGANGEMGDTIHMECPPGYNICLYRATEICTSPTPTNFEDISTDCFNNDGSFNYSAAIDRTKSMSALVNGKNSYDYIFNANYNTPSGICRGKKQLIATYACTNNMNSCVSY
jgi:hypothetical protein